MTGNQRFGLFLIIMLEFVASNLSPNRSFIEALVSVIVFLVAIYGIWLFLSE